MVSLGSLIINGTELHSPLLTPLWTMDRTRASILPECTTCDVFPLLDKNARW